MPVMVIYGAVMGIGIYGPPLTGRPVTGTLAAVTVTFGAVTGVISVAVGECEAVVETFEAVWGIWNVIWDSKSRWMTRRQAAYGYYRVSWRGP